MTFAGCAVVLAAGAGRRAGGPKAEHVLAGRRLIDRAVDTARRGGCDPVIAVVRAGTAVPDATVVVNPDPDRGLASSLELGLDAAGLTDAEFAVILLVDQPDITAEAVHRLATSDGGGHSCVWFATYAGVRDHPVRIDRALWLAVTGRSGGEVGAKALARAQPERCVDIACDDIADPTDLDTVDALRAWRPPRT